MPVKFSAPCRSYGKNALVRNGSTTHFFLIDVGTLAVDDDNDPKPSFTEFWSFVFGMTPGEMEVELLMELHKAILESDFLAASSLRKRSKSLPECHLLPVCT